VNILRPSGRFFLLKFQYLFKDVHGIPMEFMAAPVAHVLNVTVDPII